MRPINERGGFFSAVKVIRDGFWRWLKAIEAELTPRYLVADVVHMDEKAMIITRNMFGRFKGSVIDFNPVLISRDALEAWPMLFLGLHIHLYITYRK